MTLRGDERKQALARHQRHGEWFLWAGIRLALVADDARAISGIIVNDDWTSDLLPRISMVSLARSVWFCSGWLYVTAEKLRN